MGSIVKVLVGFVLSLMVFSHSAGADVSGYTPAKLLNQEKAKYPYDRFSKSSEKSVDDGLVEVLFMVDKQGQTYAPTVLRASMDKFVEPALVALEKFRYQPAQLNGEAVDSKQITTIKFKLAAADLRTARGSTAGFNNTRERGVPDGYQSHYDEFTAELAQANPDAEHMARLLDLMVELKHQTFYSLAYHSLARFRYADRFMGSAEKITALQDLVWFDPYVRDKYQILQDDMQSVIWSNLLKLQIETGQYAEALQTYDKVVKENPELAQPFEAYVTQIQGLKTSDQFTQRAFQLGNESDKVIPLLKRSFTFTDLSSNLQALHVYCDTHHATLEYVADAQYQLPADWGQCMLKISALPNSQGKLLEQ